MARVIKVRAMEIAAACSDFENHTPGPEGYLAWHSWAQMMSKTHRQERCPTCGLWTIWRPKRLVKAT
jgi:hypothetical protein